MVARDVPSPAARAWRSVVSFLRRPIVIVTEVACFAAGAALAASLPQQPDVDEIRRFAEANPVAGPVVAALGLHEVVTSAWFLALAFACTLSLVAVQLQQWPRVRRTWAPRMDAASFARAPFRRAVPLAAARAVPGAPLFRASGRLGVLGSPVFHLGLLCLVLAGLVRMLTFRDVIGRAFEGDVFATAPGAFEAERGGWLSRPFRLPRPLRVERIREERYASGALKQVSVAFALLGGETPQPREAAINAPLELGDVRIHVANAHGIAAVLELAGGASAPGPLVAYLEERSGEWRGGLRLEGGLELRLRAGATARVEVLEARVLSGGVLLGIADLRPGIRLALGGGRTLALDALPYWVQLRGSRDPSRPLFLAGVVIAISGVVLMFGFNRVDSGVFVEGGELVVALRPQRFAPIYAERFERMCKEWTA